MPALRGEIDEWPSTVIGPSHPGPRERDKPQGGGCGGDRWRLVTLLSSCEESIFDMMFLGENRTWKEGE